MQNVQSSSGITLVELLIAMVISTLVVLGAAFLFTTVQSNSVKIRLTNEMQNSLELAILKMQKSIAPAGYGLADPKSDFALTDTSLQVAFIDEFSRYACTNKKVIVAYGVEEDTLWQTVTCEEVKKKRIASPIDSLGFTGLDQAGLPTSVLEDIAAIEFTIRLRAHAKVDTSRHRSQTVRITPANFAL